VSKFTWVLWRNNINIIRYSVYGAAHFQPGPRSPRARVAVLSVYIISYIHRCIYIVSRLFVVRKWFIAESPTKNRFAKDYRRLFVSTCGQMYYYYYYYYVVVINNVRQWWRNGPYDWRLENKSKMIYDDRSIILYREHTHARAHTHTHTRRARILEITFISKKSQSY